MRPTWFPVIYFPIEITVSPVFEKKKISRKHILNSLKNKCFYCGYNIKQLENLMHRLKSHSISLFLRLLKNQNFPELTLIISQV